MDIKGMTIAAQLSPKVTPKVDNALVGPQLLIVEVVAGLITQSLALLSDAAHMFTDAAALAIALVAIKLQNAQPMINVHLAISVLKFWQHYLMRCYFLWRCTFCTKLTSALRNRLKFKVSVC